MVLRDVHMPGYRQRMTRRENKLLLYFREAPQKSIYRKPKISQYKRNFYKQKHVVILFKKSYAEAIFIITFSGKARCTLISAGRKRFSAYRVGEL